MHKHPYENLKEFENCYGKPYPDTPTLPDEDERNLRLKLLKEEYEEYLLGEKNNDIVEIADALADIVYIAFGTAVRYGIPLDEIFSEVHASNMSKLGEDGKPIYRDDGKILKGPNYFKPRIREIMGICDPDNCCGCQK